MDKLRFFLILISVLTSISATAALPVVNTQDFQPGQQWTWDYRKEDGSLYSSETYEVIEIKNTIVRLSMSTKFTDRSQIRTHHIIVADVAKCLNAYSNPVQRKAWSIQLLYWENGKWTDSGATQTLAFEEKFNCNPHAMKGPEQFEAIYKTTEAGDLFQIQRKGKIDHTWFKLKGPNAGVQAEKEFREKGRILFKSKLRQNPLPELTS